MVLHLLLTGNSPRNLDEHTDLVTLRREACKDPSPLTDTIDISHSAGDPVLRQRAAERGTGAKRFLKTLRGDIDPIVRKALAADPDRRYRNASELAAELRATCARNRLSRCPVLRRTALESSSPDIGAA